LIEDSISVRERNLLILFIKIIVDFDNPGYLQNIPCDFNSDDFRAKRSGTDNNHFELMRLFCLANQ